MKKLLTLLAGYTAGLAVAMKYRKESGKTKIDPTKSKMDNFIDEVVDMHRTAYDEVKGFLASHFDDVEDFDGLKAKAAGLLDSFATEADELIASLMNKGNTQKETIMKKVESLYTEKEAIIESARNKGMTFADVAHDTLVSWIDEAKSKLAEAHALTKSKLEAMPVKKPVARKAPVKKPQA